VEPVAPSLSRSLWTFGGIRRSDFIRGDAAIAISVEPQDERARLLDELLARDLAVLVFVKIAEIRLRQGGIGLADRFKLGLVQISVVIAIGRRKQTTSILLPFVAGVDAVVISVPDRLPVVQPGRSPRSNVSACAAKGMGS